jgi:hypothetical protein
MLHTKAITGRKKYSKFQQQLRPVMLANDNNSEG